MGGILDMGKIEMTDEYVRVGTTLYKIVDTVQNFV